MMDFFFQRHFRRRQNRKKHPAAVRQPGPTVQTSKARRRSSVGLPSVALVQSRRSSVGLPPVCTDQRRRPSVGLLVASGQRRQSIIDSESKRGAERADVNLKRGRRGKNARGASGNAAYIHRGLAVRYRRPPKVKSIEPHLLGSSMLLASLVQMGRGVKEKGEEEPDASVSSYSGSGGEEESDGEVENAAGGIEDQMHLTQAIIVENLLPRPSLRPPRCLRRNSSVFQSDETGYGVYGRYNRRKSGQMNWTLNKPIQTSTTSPSLGQLASAGLRSEPGNAETDAACASALPKSCSSPLGGPGGPIYYDPYLDTWENFLSYVTNTHTRAGHQSVLALRSMLKHTLF